MFCKKGCDIKPIYCYCPFLVLEILSNCLIMEEIIDKLQIMISNKKGIHWLNESCKLVTKYIFICTCTYIHDIYKPVTFLSHNINHVFSLVWFTLQCGLYEILVLWPTDLSPIYQNMDDSWLAEIFWGKSLYICIRQWWQYKLM